jgi:hypothetical protein
MVYFHPDLGKFWKVLNGMIGDKKGLEWKMLVFYGHLVYFVVIYSVLVCCTEKNLATLVVFIILKPFDEIRSDQNVRDFVSMAARLHTSRLQ